jgi:hypothetical protein
MAHEAETKERKFEILGVKLATPSWTGAPLTLAVHDSATMPQTPNGSLVFAYQNMATVNNAGQLALTTGGNPPLFLPVPFGANQPSILVSNWRANNLNVTNISANSATPILIEAFGPGVPGFTPAPLQVGGQVTLTATPPQVAQGTANPNWMQLQLTANSATQVILAIVGGPQDASGNNAYVIALNASANTGPGGATPPSGYYATTTANAYTFQFNWGGSTLYVANLSAATATPAIVALISL